LHDALTTLAIRIAGAGLAFALQVMLARVMAVDAYGQFVMVWTWILSLGSFASLGLADLALRMLPRYAARLRLQAMQGFFDHGFHTILRFAAVASIAVAILATAAPVSDTVRHVIYGVCLGLPLLALEFFLEGVSRAMGWFRLTTMTIYIVRPALMVGIIALIWQSGIHVTAGVACFVLAGCIAITTVFLRAVIQRRLMTVPRTTPSSRLQKFWKKQSVPMLVVSGLDDALAYMDVVLVGLLLSPAQSAVYFVASRVLTLASLAQYAFYFVAARSFSLALGEGDRTKARRNMVRATGLTVATTLVAVLATLAFSPWLLLMFGEDYADAFWLVAVLGLAQIARALSGQASELMMVSGKTRELMIINTLCLLALTLVMIAFVPHHGVMAAAWGLTLVVVLRAVLIMLFDALTKTRLTTLANAR
jgi:O-antigen/teichoic acid export membrane protein